MNTHFFLIALLLVSALPVHAQEQLVFECTRIEQNLTETYLLRIQPASKGKKAKVYFDDRDLDRAGEGGRQTVNRVAITKPTVLIVIEAFFGPETLDGVSHDAGSVSTQIHLNRDTGKLTKMDAIQGGILGANLGNGVKSSTEQCVVQSGTTL